MIVMLAFHVLEGDSIIKDGTHSSMWVSGTLTYAGVVLVANLVILYHTTTHMPCNIVIVFLSIAFFFIYWKFESTQPFYLELYRTFSWCWSAPQFYLYFFLLGAGVVCLDMGLYWVNELYIDRVEKLDRLKIAAIAL